MPSTHKVIFGGVVVTRTRIIGTPSVYYAAWTADTVQPYSLAGAQSGRMRHGTISSLPDDMGKGWMGRMGTEDLPADLDGLPARTEERGTKVRAWQVQRYQAAYDMILSAYPDAACGDYDMGEIRCTERGD